jgi:hypothetical protein
MQVDQEAGKATKGRTVVSTEDGISQMALFLDKLSSPLVRNNPKVTKTMTRVIPFLTYGNERLVNLPPLLYCT